MVKAKGGKEAAKGDEKRAMNYTTKEAESFISQKKKNHFDERYRNSNNTVGTATQGSSAPHLFHAPILQLAEMQALRSSFSGFNCLDVATLLAVVHY